MIRQRPTDYTGFELGPYRPPSEGYSLLLRVTRNCPWNHCKFCGLYKGEKFSIRDKAHILYEIDAVKACIDALRGIQRTDDKQGKKTQLEELRMALGEEGDWLIQEAASWYHSGMESVFLQDANSMILKPEDLIEILNHLKVQFPEIKRVTSYARSQTVARLSDEELKRIYEAGLTRIHIGMETGSDTLLKLVKKGADQQTHILAGQKAKKAGFELSVYYIPGLGGLEYAKESAIETARTINQINPDFIRIRSLAVKNGTPLAEDYKSGMFTRAHDNQMVEETLWMLEELEGITSKVTSDHIVNLLTEVEGVLPQDKEKMLDTIRHYLALPLQEQLVFRLGKRTGYMETLSDLKSPARYERVTELLAQHHITPDDMDRISEEVMTRYI